MDLADWVGIGFGVVVAALGLFLLKLQWDNVLDELNRDIGWQVMWHERTMEDENDGRD